MPAPTGLEHDDLVLAAKLERRSQARQPSDDDDRSGPLQTLMIQYLMSIRNDRLRDGLGQAVMGLTTMEDVCSAVLVDGT